MDHGHLSHPQGGSSTRVSLHCVSARADRTQFAMASVDHPPIDPSLGIFSSRYLHETLPQETERAQRSGQSVSVILVAIDDFQKINVVSSCGDAVLQHAVKLTRSALRHADWMARHEDDGFIVVLPATHLDGAYAAAERMRRRFTESPLALATTKVVITGSFGVACVDPTTGSNEDASALLHNACAALLEGKRTGRNRVTCGPARSLRARDSTGAN
jgi:diguanylate cyclase (GGDEF)-like protein